MAMLTYTKRRSECNLLADIEALSSVVPARYPGCSVRVLDSGYSGADDVWIRVHLSVDGHAPSGECLEWCTNQLEARGLRLVLARPRNHTDK